MRIYREYQRDQVGWFFGLTGLQLGVLAAGAVPVFSAVHVGAWNAAAMGVGGWLLLLAVTVVPVCGRTAVGWVAASAAFRVGRWVGLTGWRGGASAGEPVDADRPDLPGLLHGLRVHDTVLSGSAPRLAVVQHLRPQSWAMTAQVSHPGLGWADADGRDRFGAGLSALLDAACRTELVSEIQLLVRSVPDDGADRDLWLAGHRGEDGPVFVRRVHDGLRRHLCPAAVHVETFLTVVVPERRLRRPARDGGGGLEGRGRILAALAAEIGDQVTAQLGATRIDWLDSAQLAVACRTGFHPDDRAVLADATAGREAGSSAGVPWALAAAARAETTPRSYRHDAWLSSSTTLLLPARGARLGDLAPVLTAGQTGERRSLMVAFPIMPATLADRRTATREWAADLGDGLRAKAQVRPRAQTRADTAAARAVDAKLIRGAALTRPYAIATTTVSADQSLHDAARRLDVSIRRAGFGSQRLDLAHDTAFAVGNLPLGRTLPARGDRP